MGRTFGDWLRETRTACGIATQAELRRRLRERGYRVTPSAISKWESSDPSAAPGESHLNALFSLLAVPEATRDAVVLAMNGRRGFPLIETAA